MIIIDHKEDLFNKPGLKNSTGSRSGTYSTGDQTCGKKQGEGPGLYPGILGKGPWPNWEKKCRQNV